MSRASVEGRGSSGGPAGRAWSTSVRRAILSAASVPLASNAFASFEPIKPPPPVMTIFMACAFLEKLPRQPQHDLGGVGAHHWRGEERDGAPEESPGGVVSPKR